MSKSQKKALESDVKEIACVDVVQEGKEVSGETGGIAHG
jgi:hypothetical protein